MGIRGHLHEQGQARQKGGHHDEGEDEPIPVCGSECRGLPSVHAEPHHRAERGRRNQAVWELEHVREVILNGVIKAPAHLVPLLQVLAKEKNGEIQVSGADEA